MGEQCRGFLETGVGETFSDAGDNRDETGFGFVAAIMRSEKACEAGRGTQLPCTCLLKTRNLQRALKTVLGLRIGAAVQDEQFATQPPDLRLVHPLAAGLDSLEGFSNGSESLFGLARPEVGLRKEAERVTVNQLTADFPQP